jgi:hypothetical protein
MKRELFDIMKEEGLAHLTFTSQQIRERVAKAKIVKSVRFHLKRIRERKLYQSHVLRIQKFFRARESRVKSYVKAFKLSKYPKILVLKEQRRLFFTLLEKTYTDLGLNFTMQTLQKSLITSNEFMTLRYWYPSHPIVRSPIPLVNFSMPAYYSKVVYIPKKEKFGKNMSVFSKYGGFVRKSRADSTVNVLKSQFGHWDKKKLKEYTEKIKHEVDRGMGSVFDDYRDLVEFEADTDILEAFLRQIWLFNKTVDIENEPLWVFMPIQLHRIASAIRIQSVYRGYRFRKQLINQNLPSFNEQIVERRAVIFIQKWWQWYKIKGRLKALTKIKLWIEKINSNVLYLEENLYKKFESIIEQNKRYAQFPEQMIQFDFKQEYQIWIKKKNVELLGISERFEKQIMPKWWNVDFEIKLYGDMERTDYESDSMAILHYSENPISIIDNNSWIKGKEQTVRFLKWEFNSVEEAKRRALILALLTYRFTKKTFVQFYTDEMMNNPLILMNLRELWTAFETHNWKDDTNHLDKKSNKTDLILPHHSGLVIAEEDQYLASSHPYIKIRVKTLKGNYGEDGDLLGPNTTITSIDQISSQKYQSLLSNLILKESTLIITSTKQEVNRLKEAALEKERVLEEANFQKAQEAKNRIKEVGKRKSPTDLHVVQATKLGIEKANLSELTTGVNSGRDTQQFSPMGESDFGKRNSGVFTDEYFKHTTKRERARDMHLIRQEIEEQKKQEIMKIREINRLMKTLGKEEHDSNIRLFQKYNGDEKQIVKELIKKTKESEINEKLAKRLRVIKQNRKKDILKSEHNFALNFTRQKNLIEKYEQAGEKSKRIRKEKLDKLNQVRTLRSYQTHKPKVQLSTQLFDTSFTDEKYNKDRKPLITYKESSLNYQATMDTYRTDALSNSLYKPPPSIDPIPTTLQNSYHSYRLASQNLRNFSIRHSIPDAHHSSNSTLHPPNKVTAGARSMSGIRFAPGGSVDGKVRNLKGMFALPSLRNADALQLIQSYCGGVNYSPGKYSFI